MIYIIIGIIYLIATIIFTRFFNIYIVLSISIAIPFILFFIINSIKKLQYKNENNNPSDIKDNTKSEIFYLKKSLLTNNEIIFDKKLREALKTFSTNFYIQRQVPLSAIIEKKSNYKFANELYRTIDWGIFDKNTFECKVLLELNDKSHKSKDRYIRDMKVKSILDEVGYPLITFYTDYDNTVSYMVYKLQKYIE